VSRKPILAAVFAFLLSAIHLRAAERQRFELSVIVDGAPAAEYPFRDKTYIEALRGQSFTLRLHNPMAERIAVALSVDGLNVIDAKRATAGKATKWILAPGQTVEIPGWQVSGETSRRFFFTDTARSYAKWIGDIRNVGTIEAVFFREKARAPQPMTREPKPYSYREEPRAKDSAPSAQERSSAAGEAGGAVEGGVPAPPSEADRFAATGIGERTSFPVQWVSFDEDPVPAASVSLRYEYRRELIRLGVLSGEGDLYARDRGRGFEREYAPDPDRRK
jgi:hypothetical protein